MMKYFLLYAWYKFVEQLYFINKKMKQRIEIKQLKVNFEI